MSYARMSNTSDIYLFGTQDVLELYISDNKGSANNLPVPAKGAPAEEFTAWLNDVKPFDHPEAGAHYQFTSRQACMDKLLDLWKTGVLVPQKAIDRLRAEIQEEGDKYVG